MTNEKVNEIARNINIPIVLIHYGNSPYLYNTLYQLRQSNPKATIFLIGTKETTVYSDFIQPIFVNDYEQDNQKLKDVYQHFSTNSYDFELICIQRWFVLNNFMKKQTINRCFYMDSDILLYSKMTEIAELLPDATMTMVEISGHTNLVQQETLADFCNYVLACYSAENAGDILKKYYEDLMAKQGAGGVSDMTFLTNYRNENPEKKIINLSKPINKTVFDTTIDNNFGDFVMENGVKKITFHEKQPYGTTIHEQKLRLHTLHFQGSKSKKLMTQFIPQENLLNRAIFWVGYAKFQFIYYWQKVKQKLK